MFPEWPYYTPEKGDKVRVMDRRSLFGSPLDPDRPYYIQHVWYDAVYISENPSGSAMWLMVKADRVLPWTNVQPKRRHRLAS